MPPSPPPNPPPPYIFDSGRILHTTSLGEDIPTPEVFGIDEGGVVLRQLSISPPLAGAHPHFHGDAFNALIAGRRRWALVPPAAARFAIEAARSQFHRLRHGDGGDADDGVSSTPWLDVLQLPGDVLYIPMQWQHTTLSLDESVAVAVEFV